MMNKSQILKKIGNIIEELGEQQQYLASTNKINLLELELFTANADFLIDHIEILKKLNDRRFEVEENHEPVLEQKAPVILTPEPKTEEEKPLEIPVEEEKSKKFSFSFDEESTEMIFDFERKIAIEEVFDRSLNDDEIRLLEEKSNAPLAKPDEFIILDDAEQEAGYNFEGEDIEPFLMVKKETPEITIEHQSFAKNTQEVKQAIPEKEEIIESKPVVAESVIKQPNFVEQEQAFVNHVKPVDVAVVKDEKPLTLNEMLSAKLNSSGSQNNQRQAKKLEDLKAAISINDKMVFIKELFNGYNLAYSEAIEIVNRFDSFDAADNFLQKNYSIKNDWENKQITVGRFYEYLHKKFVM